MVLYQLWGSYHQHGTWRVSNEKSYRFLYLGSERVVRQGRSGSLRAAHNPLNAKTFEANKYTLDTFILKLIMKPIKFSSGRLYKENMLVYGMT